MVVALFIALFICVFLAFATGYAFGEWAGYKLGKIDPRDSKGRFVKWKGNRRYS